MICGTKVSRSKMYIVLMYVRSAYLYALGGVTPNPQSQNGSLRRPFVVVLQRRRAVLCSNVLLCSLVSLRGSALNIAVYMRHSEGK